MEEKTRVGIILISTRKYSVFLEPLIASLERFFFCGREFDIYLFTDNTMTAVDLPIKRATMHVFPIESWGFPWVTLYRYKIMARHADSITSHYVFYMDVDMLLVGAVGEEICSKGLVATQHPGYYKGGWGSRKTHSASLFYLQPSEWHDYYCGGFQGGERDAYLSMAGMLWEMIDMDMDTALDMGYEKNNGILAEWHDESAYNWWLKRMEAPTKVLTPSYCYPESWSLPFEKKILALDKNHKEIRS